METINEKSCSFVQCWFFVQTVGMKLTPIVVNNGSWWNRKAGCEDGERVLRWFTLLHDLEAIAHSMWAVTSFYHYWSKPISTIVGPNQFLPLLVWPVSAIIGPNQFLPLLVQTSFYHYWYNQFLLLLVQTSFCHYWSKPVSAIIGPNQFLPLLVPNQFLPLLVRPVSAIIGAR